MKKIGKKGAFQNLTPTALAFGAFVVAVTMVVVLLDQLGNVSGLGTDAVNVADTGRNLVGTLVTSWSSLIILFIVFGILFALLAVFLVNRMGRGR